MQGTRNRMNINVLKQLNTRSKRALRHSLSINPQPAICIERRSHVVLASSGVLSAIEEKKGLLQTKKLIAIDISWLSGHRVWIDRNLEIR